MCNLYRLRRSAEEVAAFFGAEIPKPIEFYEDTAPGRPGLIVRGTTGRRVIQQIDWGFPRLTAQMKAKGQAPTRVNLAADLTNPMWSAIAPDPRYRCLIPLTDFGEPDGERGRMTRTWFNIRDEPIFAWAGFVRNTELFGPVYAGMTSDSNEAVLPLNPRMPTLLKPHEYDRWLTGPIDDVLGFQFRSYPSEWLEIERTSDLWVQRGGASQLGDLPATLL